MNIQPPQNIDAEKEFLGACIISPSIVRKCAIRPEYFYVEKHRVAFIAMQNIVTRGEDLSQIIVSAETKGIVPVMDIIEWIATAQVDALWKFNQKQIIAAWKMRRLLVLGKSLVEGVAEKKDFEEMFKNGQDTLNSIATGNDIDIVRYHDVVMSGLKAIEDRHGKGSIAGVPTGVELLDDITDGLQEDEFTLVAARPGIGKSAFAQGLMHHAAGLGYPCGLINLEMSNRQIGIRALSSKSKIPITLLRKAAIQENEWRRLTNCLEPLAGLPIYVADSAYSDRKIVQVMYRMVHELKCKLLVVDYLQLMESDEHQKGGSREREVAGFSRALKKTAKALHVPIVALAQINRASEDAKDKKPGIHNLRESGALEADADRILLIHVPHCSCSENLECICGNRNALELIVGKGRNDPKGSIMVEWNGPTTSFGRSYWPGKLPESTVHYQESRRWGGDE